jgi:multisubunit Na+/H+ antiporter MnhB subunit
VSAGCAIALLVLMFATEWFGVDQLPGKASGLQRETAENAWAGLSVVRWVMLTAIIVALGSVMLHATQQTHGARTDTGGLTAGVGGLAALLLVYRVLINLPGPDEVVDQKLGAVLGLLCAVGIALGGCRSIIDERVEPESRDLPKQPISGGAPRV